MREDDGILTEVMMADDAVLEQFAELRRYVEYSHEELSKGLARLERKFDGRFEQVAGRLEQVDARFEHVDSRFDQMDTRFDRLERKIDALIPARRAPRRRRKP